MFEAFYKLFFVKKKESLSPISLKGTDAKVGGDSTDKNHIPIDAHEMWFPSDSTIILGMRQDPNKPFKGCSATWYFDVSSLPNKKRRKLVSADLHINTFRTHAGINIDYERKEVEPLSEAEVNELKEERPFEVIYINDKRTVRLKRGYIKINKRLVDNIDLVCLMPTGRYYGYNKVGHYPIINFIKDAQTENQNLEITIELDPAIYWDIDEVKIDSIVVETYELRQVW